MSTNQLRYLESQPRVLRVELLHLWMGPYFSREDALSSKHVCLHECNWLRVRRQVVDLAIEVDFKKFQTLFLDPKTLVLKTAYSVTMNIFRKKLFYF